MSCGVLCGVLCEGRRLRRLVLRCRPHRSRVRSPRRCRMQPMGMPHLLTRVAGPTCKRRGAWEGREGREGRGLVAAVMRKERPLISALWVQWVPPRHTQGPRAQMALAAGRWLGAMRRCVMGKGRKQEAKADGGAFGLHRRSRGAQGSCADTLPICAACLTVLILAACVCVSRVGSSIGSCVHDAPPPPASPLTPPRDNGTHFDTP